jgi:hypothetical protein
MPILSCTFQSQGSSKCFDQFCVWLITTKALHRTHISIHHIMQTTNYILYHSDWYNNNAQKFQSGSKLVWILNEEPAIMHEGFLYTSIFLINTFEQAMTASLQITICSPLKVIFPSHLIWYNLCSWNNTTMEHNPSHDAYCCFSSQETQSLWNSNWNISYQYHTKFRVFWYVLPCSLRVDQHFRGVYCLWNIGLLWDYTALHPRRL